MNIWIFNHYAVAPGGSGGTRHYDLAKQLVEQGHQVTIFASSFSYQSLTEGEEYNKDIVYKEKFYNNVRFVWIKTHPYRKNDHHRVLNMFSYSWRSYFLSKQLEEKPDVIIGSLVHPLAALTGYFVSRKKHCTFYFEERDLWPQTLIDLGKISKNNPAIILLSSIEKFLYKKAKRIIVLFDKAVDYVKSKGIEEDKVLYLPNGVDLTRYEADSIELPEQLKQTLQNLSGKFIAIYLGVHGKANNLDVILDAAKRLDRHESIHFLFVGDGPEKQRLVQRKQAEEINNVTFHPPIQKELVPVLLRQVDLGLLPLADSPVFKWGISPNKLFDYMASALPVILLCNLEGTPVEKSGGGLVIRDNYCDNLVQGLIQLSESKEKAKLMGEKAKEYVRDHHSWDILSKQLIRFMEKDVTKIK